MVAWEKKFSLWLNEGSKIGGFIISFMVLIFLYQSLVKVLAT